MHSYIYAYIDTQKWGGNGTTGATVLTANGTVVEMGMVEK